MPRDPNGVYTLPPSYRVQTGDTVLPVQHNPPFEDVANALTESLARDGRTEVTGDLKMGGHRITNTAPGVFDGDVATLKQVGQRASFKTVQELLNDSTMSYDTGPIRVALGDIVKAQGFRYEVAARDGTDAHVETAGGVKLNVIDLTLMPEMFGAQGDGIADDTAAINKMFDVASGKTVVFKARTFLTGKFNVPKDCTILMSAGCWIKDSGVLGPNDRLMNINQRNVYIEGYGAKITMNRADYTTGEQRHCVDIRGGKDVTIKGLEASGSGGDGFYIGVTEAPTERIKLIDIVAHNNRRQGISVTNCRDFEIINPYITTTGGTAPEAGIDIEPNKPSDIVIGKILGGRIDNNTGPGIIVLLDPLDSTSEDVDLVIDGVSTSGNLSGLLFRNRSSASGRVSVRNFKADSEANSGIQIIDWNRLISVDIDRPHISNPNESGGTDINSRGGITVYQSSMATGDGGRIRINRPIIEAHNGGLNSSVRAISLNAGARFIEDVEVIDPIIIGQQGSFPWQVGNEVRKCRFTADELRYKIQYSSGFDFIDGRHFGRLVTNLGATGVINGVLPSATASRVGYRYTVLLETSQEFRISPAAGNTIRGGGAGQHIRSNVAGNTITLECYAPSFWRIVNQVGTWVFA